MLRDLPAGTTIVILGAVNDVLRQKLTEQFGDAVEIVEDQTLLKRYEPPSLTCITEMTAAPDVSDRAPRIDWRRQAAFQQEKVTARLRRQNDNIAAVPRAFRR